MHVKFIARGTGSARAAAKYLLGERDAAGNVRDGIEVRRGDPDRVAAVADALAFEHKYTSGVIAWAPEDRPTDAQIEAVLDRFEKTAWAGLEPDRYAWTAVEHREHGGGVHVHVLAARCDLVTGKSLNIAPPGWQKTFGPLRDAFNHEHSWSRARRPGAGEDPAARPPGLHRRGEPAGRSGGRGRPARVDAGLPGAARRARRRPQSRRRRRRPERSGTRDAAAGQELRDRPRPGDREAVAAEGSVVRA